MSEEHPFQRLTSAHHERQAAFAERQYEEGRVTYLLKVMRLSGVAKRLRCSGNAGLTFAAFNEEFSSYPMLLGASTLGGIKLHLDKTAILPALFRDFAHAPFVRAYEEFMEQHAHQARGRALGLVFPRKGLRQGLVIHNDGIEAVNHHGLMLVYKGRDKTHLLYVRPFQQLVEAVYAGGHGWRP